MRPATDLVLRYADVGVATYASLRVVGDPARTVTWTLEEPLLITAVEELAEALPEAVGGETAAEAVLRARNHGGFRDPDAELTLAYRLAVLLIPMEAWKLLLDCVADPRPSLFVSPSARLGRVPWGQLAVPTSAPDFVTLLRASAEAVTTQGTGAARIDWPDARQHTFRERIRLMELADVAMVVPANVAAHRRTTAPVIEDRPLLVLDPRVPGQRADGALGSVLGRPTPDSLLSRHYEPSVAHGATLPHVAEPVALFRRPDADRRWLVDQLEQRPSRMVFVGHVSAAPDGGGAEATAMHLACRADHEGAAEPVGDHRPLQVRDLLDLGAPIPPRVALLACASGGDYRFDEAAGLVAAMVLGGAELVTATLWSLPTAAGFRQAAPGPSPFSAAAEQDPMSEVVIAVDTAHQDGDPGRVVNNWQRAQMRRWREGDITAHPIYWAAVTTYRFSDEDPR